MKPTSSEQVSLPAAARQSPRGLEPVVDPLAVSIKAAARMIGVSRTVLYQLINGGEIPSFTVGRRRLLAIAELRRFVAERAGGDRTPSPGQEHQARPAQPGRP
jgi:excisionase family DNA binding protein